VSVYIPTGSREKHLLERLSRLAKKRDRSVNYLIVDAIKKYIDREETK
jgi:predicted transcriptional regulator